MNIGDQVRLEIGPVAHGGHCVARHEGQVVFVRHTLPGEVVVAEITSVGTKFLRADAIEVITASPDRVVAPCPFSGPGRCGGCDFQHVSLPAQRGLKGEVLAEQLQRLAGIEMHIEVEALPNPRRAIDDGLGWRTRVTLTGSSDGRVGLRKHRSHEVQAVSHCPIAVDEINALVVDGFGIFQRPLGEGVGLEAVSTSAGQESVLLHEGREQHLLLGTMSVREQVGEHRFAVRADGFWQVHPGAALALTEAVIEGLRPAPGHHILDLYAGSGLFTLPIAERVGEGGRVEAIEGERRAVANARRNIGDRAWVHVHEGDVATVLRRSGLRRCDGMVLDPPRTGAGKEVLRAIASLQPARIVYVACDPAAFARDVRYLAESGYRLEGARAFDLFPMTHHLETVGVFIRG